MPELVDYLHKYDLGERHPLLDAVRRTYRTQRDFQYKSRDEILDFQFKNLKQLVNHASKTIPIYQSLYGGTIDIQNWDDFHALPELNREHLIEWPIEQRISTKLTPETAPKASSKTSGTTGVQIEAPRSIQTEVWRAACRIIEYEWMNLDPSGDCVSVRFHLGNTSPNWDENLKCEVLPNWEEGALKRLIQFGKGYNISLGIQGKSLAEFICKVGAKYLCTTSTLMESAMPFVVDPKTEILIAIGEKISSPARQKLNQAYGANVYDIYGAREFGRIAAQCPEFGGHHVHDSNIHFEVVNEDRFPVESGGTGNVLVTSLQNPGMPLIRYRLGDVASLGRACGCGRGLTKIADIAGREISRIYLRGGRIEHGRRTLRFIEDLGTVGAFRLRQKDYELFTLEMTPAGSISEEGLAGVKALLSEITESEVTLNVALVDEMPITPAGKRTKLVHDFEPA